MISQEKKLTLKGNWVVNLSGTIAVNRSWNYIKNNLTKRKIFFYFPLLQMDSLELTCPQVLFAVNPMETFSNTSLVVAKGDNATK